MPGLTHTCAGGGQELGWDRATSLKGLGGFPAPPLFSSLPGVYNTVVLGTFRRWTWGKAHVRDEIQEKSIRLGQRVYSEPAHSKPARCSCYFIIDLSSYQWWEEKTAKKVSETLLGRTLT